MVKPKKEEGCALSANWMATCKVKDTDAVLAPRLN
jgi:hypothetical protein